MPVVVGLNSITGISTAVNSTDAAYKEYADLRLGSVIPDLSSESIGKFLFTNGSTVTWEPIGSFVEYNTPGNYTFNIPQQASQFFIEMIGGGGGGASANLNTTSYIPGLAWRNRTSVANVSYQAAFSSSTPASPALYFAAGDSGRLITSTDTINWTLRTVGASTNQLRAVLFANNTYFAAGVSGVLNTSTDAIHWTLRTSGMGFNAIQNHCMIFGSVPINTYVICGDNGNLRTSTDFINWVGRTAGFSSNVIGALAFENNTYIAGTINRILNTSTDAIHWTLRTSGGPVSVGAFSSFAFANNTYIGATAAGQISISTDSITWVMRTSGFGSTAIRAVMFANNTYIAAGDSGILTTSTDTITWSLRTSGDANANRDIHFNSSGPHNQYLIVGDSNTIRTSPLTVPAISGGGGGSAASGAWNLTKNYISGSTLSVFVGAGGASNTAGAASTVSWAGPQSRTFSFTVSGGFAGENTVIGLGGTGGFIHGGNNSNFLRGSSGLSGASGIIFQANGASASAAITSFQSTGGGGGSFSENGLASNGGAPGTITFYGASQNVGDIAPPTIMGRNAEPILGLSYGNGGGGGGSSTSSTLPLFWSIRTTSNTTSQTLNGLAFGTSPVDTFVVSGAGGRLLTSTNSIVWAIRTSAFGGTTLNRCFFANNGYLLSSGIPLGGLASSTDAISWVLRTSGLNNSIEKFVFANNLYTLVASTSVSTSTDAITWELRTGGNGSNGLTDINFMDNLYIITGTNGVLNTSTDAISWTLRTSGFGFNTANTIIFGTNPVNTYVAGGASGRLHTSTDAIHWTVRTNAMNSQVINASLYANNTYFIAGGSGIINLSTDAITWETRNIVSRINTINSTCLIYANTLNTFVTAGASGALSTSNPQLLASSGGIGILGGGGGGGSYEQTTNTVGAGGAGGNGFVRISWV